MPELPEVESVRRVLEKHLSGDTITAVTGPPVPLRRPLDPSRLASHLNNRRLGNAQRIAKFLRIPIQAHSSDQTCGHLIAHLGMSGRFIICDPQEPIEKHTHLRIRFESGQELRYVDPRRFGFIDWLALGDTDPSLARLGLDPLTDDFPTRFAPAAKAKRSAIKLVLMDQSVVGGVGNIYANEALWHARIRPTRPANRVAKTKLELLAECAQSVLRVAIERGGTTLRDHAAPDGVPGDYFEELQVYGKEDLPCPRCDSKLKGIRMSNRATVYCSSCQR